MAGSTQFSDVPYRILALAPLAPVPERQGLPPLVSADLSSLDAALEALAPTLRIGVPKAFCPEAWVTVAPRALRDFRPERLVAVCPYLRDLEAARALVQEARGSGRAFAEVRSELHSRWPQLPLQTQDAPAAPAAKADAVDDILAMVAAPQVSAPAGGGGLSGLLTELESLMAGVLQAVYDDPGFRSCEAAWRGAQLLLQQAEAKEGGGIELLLMPVDTTAPDFPELLDALLPELAGDLPNLVLVEALLDSAPQRIDLARKLADFAENLLAPTLVGVGPEFFRLDAWSQLSKIQYINHFLEDMAFAKWRTLRKEAGARWLAAVLNPLLARPPYGEAVHPRTPFFSEAAPLWLHPAWGAATLVARSVRVHGWPSRVTDYHSVFLADLPVQASPQGVVATQAPLGEDRLAEFAEAGFAPVIGMLLKDRALLPRLPGLNGEPLAPQLFLNRVLGFLFWCKENLAATIESGDVAENLQAAFSLFWQRTGHSPPADLSISAGEAEEGSLPLAIRFTPPKDVLPGAAPLEFTFSW